jgi:hypothetical protein
MALKESLLLRRNVDADGNRGGLLLVVQVLVLYLERPATRQCAGACSQGGALSDTAT